MDDTKMAKYPGLNLRKNGVWYVRKRVPVDLKHVFSSESERRSLETRDKREAIRLYPFRLAEIEAAFDQRRAELRSRGTIETALATSRLDQLGQREIEAIASDWWLKRKAHIGPMLTSLEEQDAAIHAAREDIGLFSRAQQEGRDVASEVTDRVLVEAGIASGQHRVGAIKTVVKYPSVDRTSEAYQTLRDLICNALQIEGRLALDHATGERTAPAHPLFNPDPKMAAMPSGVRLTVTDLISRYRTERELQYGTESTNRKYGLLFRVLNEVWGPHLALQDINRQRCVELVNFINQLPSNGTKKFPKLTLAQSIEAAKAGGHETLAPKTVSTYVQNLRAMLNWADENDLGVKVNTRGLVVDRGARVQRRGFEPNELRKLFHELEQFRVSEPWKYWVPALAVFTGARAGEICQLHTEDVVTLKGIDCLNLTLFDAKGRRVEGKKLKNKQSERFVPVHDELIRAGFLDFARASSGQTRLFPELTPGSKGSYSHSMSKWFGRLMDRIDLNDPSLVFHSFRHGFRDACRDADLPDSTADALGGWASINQGQKYGKRGAVTNLHRALKKIRYHDFHLVPPSESTETTNEAPPMGEQSDRKLQPVATVDA